MKSLAFLLILATPASALSCIEPSPLRQYIDARDSKDLYSMVIGKIEPYGAIKLPKQDLNSNQTNKAATTRARLSGRALTSDGFTVDYQGDITLNIGCLSIWCGGAPATNAEVFVTLRHNGDTRLLDLGPCPTNALPWTAEDETRVLNCHRFGKCAEVR